MKYSIKDLFSNIHQILRKLRIWSHLLKKSLMENFIFYTLYSVSSCVQAAETLCFFLKLINVLIKPESVFLMLEKWAGLSLKI